MYVAKVQKRRTKGIRAILHLKGTHVTSGRKEKSLFIGLKKASIPRFVVPLRNKVPR